MTVNEAEAGGSGSSAMNGGAPPIAIVTGCSTGIGFATALRLAQEGCKVYATVRSEASGAALAAASAGLALSLVIVDVDSDESVATGLGSVVATEGRVDILVNNAGVSGGDAVETTPMSEFQSIMNTNTWGVVRGIQAILPTMREQRSGCIVNVTSLAGRIACAGMGAYSASKWATEAISEALAAEVAQFGIRIIAIEPGVVVTPIFDKAFERPPDVTSPYFDVTFRTSRLLLAGLEAPATPDETADVIWNAITSDAPTMRHTVGTDAANLVAHRAALTDEEWVAGLSVADDAVWRANMLEWTGTAIPPM